jgi:hypothetical protein
MSDNTIKKILYGVGAQLELRTLANQQKAEVFEEAAQQLRQEQELARLRGYEKGVADTLKIVKKSDYLKQLKKKSRYE